MMIVMADSSSGGWLAIPSYKFVSLPTSLLYLLHHDWAPPQSIDYSLFDTVIFAFALPDQNYALSWDTEQAPSLLSNLISAARPHGTKVSLSIGGWTGSRPVSLFFPSHSLTPTRWFSEAVATAQHRDTFVNNILDVYNSFTLDGIDIDWEYPGQIAQQGNSESST
ncbi:glycoside hydrolase superfamily [Chiua virens]|nr:glycoside hydrolase superfamily [Chiua virens]